VSELSTDLGEFIHLFALKYSPRPSRTHYIRRDYSLPERGGAERVLGRASFPDTSYPRNEQDLSNSCFAGGEVGIKTESRGYQEVTTENAQSQSGFQNREGNNGKEDLRMQLHVARCRVPFSVGIVTRSRSGCHDVTRQPPGITVNVLRGPR